MSFILDISPKNSMSALEKAFLPILNIPILSESVINITSPVFFIKIEKLSKFILFSASILRSSKFFSIKFISLRALFSGSNT